MDERKYYEAYDDRFSQIHEAGLRWFSDLPSPIVGEVIDAFGLSCESKMLELGCGEGRDAACLLNRGFRLLATDISPEAIRYCREKNPRFPTAFRVMDCVAGHLDETFDFIYAVAVVHMLVPDEDRQAFYRFVREHLAPGGIGLICTMGDGETERQTDICKAFERQERIHEQTGKTVRIAGTSCRMVNFHTFGKELEKAGLMTVQAGLTAAEPDFPVMMYAVVKRA